MKKKAKVMMIGPSRNTRGGITTVLGTYSRAGFWKEWECYWLETHIDKSLLHKFIYALRAYAKFAYLVHKYQILHIHFSEPPSAVRKTFFFIPALLLRKRIILHFHSFSPETTTKSRFAPLYRFLFDRADMIIVLSETWKKEVSGITGNPNLCIVYNPAPIHESSIIRTAGTDGNYILFAGTLNERKGFRDLIKAFTSVSANTPGWKLILAGNGEIEEGKALATKLGIIDKVEFKGWVSGSEKDTLFTNAGIFCLPSYAEGFPMAVIDGISYGIPVITTPVGGILDVLEPEKDILAFTPGDVQGLTKALDRLISSRTLRNNLAENALQKTEKLFDIQSIGVQLGLIYENLVRQKS
jgi:glycosyltransferase involved in cell wall biosynthesis